MGAACELSPGVPLLEEGTMGAASCPWNSELAAVCVWLLGWCSSRATRSCPSEALLFDSGVVLIQMQQQQEHFTAPQAGVEVSSLLAHCWCQPFQAAGNLVSSLLGMCQGFGHPSSCWTYTAW